MAHNHPLLVWDLEASGIYMNIYLKKELHVHPDEHR